MGGGRLDCCYGKCHRDGLAFEKAGCGKRLGSLGSVGGWVGYS